MSYTELTQGERYQIYALKKAGHKQTEIAEIMGRDPGTISWELRRNRRLKGYHPRQAHNVALVRRCNKVQPRISSWVWQQVEALIREQWSPEQVAGRLETEQGVCISHEWIYQYSYADKHSGSDLHCQKARRKRYGTYDQRGLIPIRSRSMNARPSLMPAAVSVISKGHRDAMVTLVERKSFTLLSGRSTTGQQRRSDLRLRSTSRILMHSGNTA